LLEPVLLLKETRGCTGSLSISDEAAAYGELRVATIAGARRNGSLKLMGYSHEVNWWYADRPISLRGQQQCSAEGGSRTYRYDLDLKLGWNVVTSLAVTRGGLVTDVVTGPVPAGSRWVYTPDTTSVGNAPGIIGGPDAGSSGQSVRGTLGGWTQTQDAPGTLHAVTVWGDSLAEAPINLDGSFDLAMPTPDPDLIYTLDLAIGCDGTISNSNPDVSGAEVFFEAWRGYDLIGYVRVGGDAFWLSWVYTDQPTTVTGSETCDWGDGDRTSWSYNLNLSAGWNIVKYALTVAPDKSETYWATSGPLPADSRWFFEPYSEEGGEDRGSNGTLLAGTAPNYPGHTLAAHLVFTGESSSLGRIAAATLDDFGAFTLALPDLSGRSQDLALEPLEFDLPDCPGTISLSDPQARYDILTTDLYDADGHYAAWLSPGRRGSNGDRSYLQWWYLDRATMVTGSETCQGYSSEAKSRYDISLQAGWNLVEIAESTDLLGNRLTAYSRLDSAPAGSAWFAY
ncbi:MAG TPA: hypothetical protein VNT60_04740, partial [Deinococcales bacterium]|nr:hypothetical protein [Deinococcales bacterium]